MTDAQLLAACLEVTSQRIALTHSHSMHAGGGSGGLAAFEVHHYQITFVDLQPAESVSADTTGELLSELITFEAARMQRDKPADAHADTERAP